MVMFDFSNKETPDYKNYSIFVDIETNKPISIEKIDKKKFPFPYVENAELPKIFTQENFLSKKECEYLVWMAETILQWPKSSSNFWDERTFSLFDDLSRHRYAEVETAKLILSIHSKVKEFVSTAFGKECYADQIGIIRWPPGSFQPPHIDNVPEFNRVAGCVIYLNDDYEGGETFYPYYKKIHTPKIGSIFAHDSGHSHLHGVTKIKEKTRYTISSTWTENPYQSAYEKQITFTQNYLNTVQPK